MSKLVKGVGLAVIGLLSILIISCVITKTNRQHEVDESLNTAIHQTIKMMHEDRYKITSNKELVAEFHSNLIQKISSNSKLEVAVYDVDYQKGLLDVELKEKFKYPHGVTGTVTSRKTMVIDEVKNN